MLKKTVEQIIEGGNDYVITLKANQPTLHQQAQQLVDQAQQSGDYEQFIEVDTSRNRYVCWLVKVVKDLSHVDLDWTGLASIIEVTRCGLRQGQPFHEVHYYISSLQATAQTFAQGIRGHWGIENLLHWVKDVIFGEDKAPFAAFNAATNWSIIRNIAINIARQNGYHSLTKAERFLAHDIPQILSFLE